MKLNKHILEAINRGVLLALDNFEDIEDNSSTPNDIINANDVIKLKVDLFKEFVDLGLPSGTLWCKHNLGAINETDFGDYYAWGEIETKDRYTWENYKFGIVDSAVRLKKYTPHPLYGYDGGCDHLTQLLPEDDAATLNMHLYNYKISIPTVQQLQELYTYTNAYNKDINSYIKENYKKSGVNGVKLISKINGNSIFMPSAGRYYYSNPYDENVEGFYWTSNILKDTGISAYHLYFAKNSFYIDKYDRAAGMPIRPVCNLKTI